jgi:hypothetical protein
MPDLLQPLVPVTFEEDTATTTRTVARALTLQGPSGILALGWART